MLAALYRLNLASKIVLVHSDLGEMEWEPMEHWIEKNSFGLPLHVVRSEMSFFDLARRYGRLPSGQQQFCTDFLKTKPIEAFIHDYMNKHGIKTAINATGMRAEESPRRAKKEPFTLSQGAGTSGMFRPRKYPEHLVFDWLPIFDYNTADVFGEIAHAGQEPHQVYSMGFSRLSCVFCVNGRIDEHQKAAELRPELAKKVAELERELGKTYRIKQVKGVKLPKYFDEYLTSFCE
jgi:3'-phosphoadenosine 5'-phosphosulfate sulfotransferase (PAPS reductase)/FAD synthetase